MNWTTKDIPDQTGRTFVITGANSGIGLGAAQALAAANARIVLAVRNVSKGEAAAKQIAGETEVRPLDLADLASVRAFAQAFETDIDVLINNAGVMNVPHALTADGFEMQIGTNHLGHFALTNLLLPRIKERVVVVASGSHRYGKIKLDDLNSERGYHRHRAYGQAKLANLLFMSELQRRLIASGSDVKVTGAHPGWAATNLQTRSGNFFEDGIMKIGNRLLAQDQDMGALPTLYAATMDLPGDAYIGPGGRFEMRGYPAPAGRSGAATDAETAAKLWERSELLTGVSFPRGALSAV